MNPSCKVCGRPIPETYTSAPPEPLCLPCHVWGLWALLGIPKDHRFAQWHALSWGHLLP